MPFARRYPELAATLTHHGLISDEEMLHEWQARRELREEASHCEVCRQILRTQYYELAEPQPLMAVGHEEPVAQVVHNFRLHRINWIYFGPIEDLKSGKFISTPRVCPRDEFDVIDFHQRHGQVDNVEEYIRGQIACSKRVNAFEQAHRQMVNDNGRILCNINWESRVCDNPLYTERINRGDYDGMVTVQHSYWDYSNATSTTASNTSYYITAGTDLTRTIFWDASDEQTRFIQPIWHHFENYEQCHTRVWRHRFRQEGWPYIPSRETPQDSKYLSEYEAMKLVDQLFVKVPNAQYKKLSPSHRKMLKARYKSEKLLKQWMTAEEYKALISLGEVEVKDLEDPDTIYIIKKDPKKEVEVKKKGKLIETICVVATDESLPAGDRFLMKFMQLKHNKQYFMGVGNHHTREFNERVDNLADRIVRDAERMREEIRTREDGRVTAPITHHYIRRGRQGVFRRTREE